MVVFFKIVLPVKPTAVELFSGLPCLAILFSVFNTAFSVADKYKAGRVSLGIELDRP